MADKKVTKKDRYNVLIEMVQASELENKDEYVEFLKHEIELLSNRSSKSGSTPIQKANNRLIALLKDILGEQESPVTITNLMADPRLATYTVEKADGVVTEVMTNQKLSSLMKKLVDAHEVDKTIIKKVAYFSLTAELDD